MRLTNTYDGAGNRTNVRDNLGSAGSMTFTYDPAHRMANIDSSVGGSSSVQAALGYDNADRLTSLSRKACKLCQDQTLTTFSYDNTDRVTLITHTYSPSGESPTTLLIYLEECLCRSGRINWLFTFKGGTPPVCMKQGLTSAAVVS